MGFDTIPAIPEDYPLYDWADWQSSRDALVSGGPTKYFLKEAWNSIVDELADAITAAGQEWDTTYTTAAGAKITAANRKLYARKFNSVRLNIDRQMHLEWPWAVNESRRGYVGREYFRGRQDVGKACDKVYPEYILELVRKLNLLLEIMRGTGPICDASNSQLLVAPVAAAAQSGKGVRADYRYRASTEIIAFGARSGKAAHAAATSISKSMRDVDVQTKESEPISCAGNIPSLIAAGGRSRTASPAEPESLDIRITLAADAMSINRQRISHVSVSQLCATSNQTDANAKQSAPTVLNDVTAHSVFGAEINKGFPMPAVSVSVSDSKSRSELGYGFPSHVSANVTPKIVTSADLDGLKSSAPQCTKTCDSTVICTAVDTCWLTPIRINGGLWIRQVHDAPVQRENGELEVT